MQALPAQAERAGEARLGLERPVVARRRGGRRRTGRGCRPRPSRRRASSARTGSRGRRRAARAELGAEVDGPEHERRHPGQARRLVGEAEALRRLDDRDHRRAVGPSASTASGVAFGRTIASSGELADGREVVVEELGAGAVDADRLRAARGSPSTRRDELARSAFSAGATASSRSATTASAPGLERASQLALVRAGREEERADVRASAAVAPLYVRHSEHVKPA